MVCGEAREVRCDRSTTQVIVILRLMISCSIVVSTVFCCLLCRLPMVMLMKYGGYSVKNVNNSSSMNSPIGMSNNGHNSAYLSREVIMGM